MYLHKKSYYGGKWRGKDGHKGEHTLKMTGKFVDEQKIDLNRVTDITEDVAYWRKSNQVHNFFIEHCAGGNHDETTMMVSIETLKKLLDTCKTVKASSELVDGKIKNGSTVKDGKWEDIIVDGKNIKDSTIAEMLLPTQSGFFFGSTDYDEYYMQDIDITIEQLEKVVADEEEMNKNKQYSDFEYHASW